MNEKIIDYTPNHCGLNEMHGYAINRIKNIATDIILNGIYKFTSYSQVYHTVLDKVTIFEMLEITLSIFFGSHNMS